MALEITTRETRERELNERVERKNSTIQQLRRELKKAQFVQPRESSRQWRPWSRERKGKRNVLMVEKTRAGGKIHEIPDGKGGWKPISVLSISEPI